MSISLKELEEMVISFPSNFDLVKQELLNKIKQVKLEYVDRDTSVSWSIEDFEHRAEETWTLHERPSAISWEDVYDKDEFEHALISMVNNHDASLGICWDTIDYYLDSYCLKEIP